MKVSGPEPQLPLDWLLLYNPYLSGADAENESSQTISSPRSYGNSINRYLGIVFARRRGLGITSLEVVNVHWSELPVTTHQKGKTYKSIAASFGFTAGRSF